MVCRFTDVTNGTALERNGTATSATTAICPTPTAAEYGSLDLDAYGMATIVLSLATDGMHFILNQIPNHPQPNTNPIRNPNPNLNPNPSH